MPSQPSSPRAAVLPSPLREAGDVRAPRERTWRQATLWFLKAFPRAVLDGDTYDVRSNPILWLGFLMALPIPFLIWAADPPAWLLLLSIPAPAFWGVAMGAAGRVGIEAALRARQLQEEIDETRSEALADRENYEVALDEEVQRRHELENREERAISELKLAESVHRTLLPDNIERGDVQVAVRQIPSLYVGGDYLYAAVAADRWLYLVVGDVTGHGVSAALVVARLHGLIRRLTLAQRSRPITILDHVNRAALEIFRHTYFFLTLGVFRLDLQTGVLQYATAGHPSQVLLRGNGRFDLLRTPNRLLGIDGDVFDARHPSGSVTLEPGDTLVLFTDGLYEILNGEGGEILGESGLHERIRPLAGLSPPLLAGEILQELADFQGRSTFEDDVSLIVATYTGRSDKHPTFGHLR